MSSSELIEQLTVEITRLTERKYRAEAEEAEAKRDAAKVQLERERVTLQAIKDQVAIAAMAYGPGGGDA